MHVSCIGSGDVSALRRLFEPATGHSVNHVAPTPDCALNPAAPTAATPAAPPPIPGVIYVA